MNIVKKTLIVALTVSLVVACSKPEETRSNDNRISQAEESRLAEQAAAEEAARLEEEAAQAARIEQETKKAQEESERLAHEARRAKEKAEQEKQAALRKAAEAENARLAAQKQAQKEEALRLAALEKEKALQAQSEEDARKLAETEEQERWQAEKKAAEVEAQKLLAEAEAKKQQAIAEQLAAKAENAKKLKQVAEAKTYDFSDNLGDKTPVGAQKSGNAEGTIPAWTGGITQAPAEYKPGDHHQDPFASDKILFTIDASNFQDYADKLSVGQKAMFEKYPDTYKMPVYQTRRSASFPERIYQKTIENGKTGKLTGGGEGVENVAEGFPFPNPKNAYELILNHKLKFKGSGGVRYNNQVAPTATGRYTVVKLKEELLGKYYTEGNTIEDINNILLYFYQVVESPARLAGRILLVHETMNQQIQPRQAWIYNPGQRRVRRAPNVAYDNPGTASDGLRTNDMTDMFNGAMDRFDWKVVGKKEMYVPYNSYKVHSGDLDYSDIVRAGHLNQDLMRYELHRMWVVEATLKEGVRHINSRRTFYLDEDSYQIMLTDHYDRRGAIWRFSEAHSINYYDVPTFWSTVETHHDLRSGRYVAVGLDNKDPVNTFNVPLSEANYTPQALRKRGRR